MLGEGHRRAERGTDVVVGFVETHGRAHTAEMVDGPRGGAPPHAGLPRRRPSPRWTSTPCSPGARRSRWSTSSPTPTCPGSRNAKRWQDIEELLAAGIDVITTVNIQHLESVNDVVEKITGVPQRETVPDAVVRAADQIELEDMTAEALRRRLAHGNVYAPEKVDAALANYFRAGNLNALRELALLWTADRVDDALQQYRETARHHRHLGGPRARRRRAHRRARGRDARSAARPASPPGPAAATCSPSTSPGPTASSGASQGALAAQRLLVESLGGTYHQVARRRRRPRRCSPSPAPRTPPSWCSATAAAPRWPRLFGPGIGERTRSATPATSTSTSSPTATPAGAWPCPTAAAASAPRRKAAGLRPRRRCCRRC